MNLKEREMIADARKDYVGIVSRFGLARLREYGLEAALVSAKKRGLRLRVISEIDSSNVRFADRLARYVDLRLNHDLLLCMDIVDWSEMLFGPAFPTNEEEAKSLDNKELDIWTTNPRFVHGMYAMFERLWEASPSYESQKRHSTRTHGMTHKR